jgi:hypothetical protein
MAATWATADFVAMCGRTVFLPFAQIPGTVVPPAATAADAGDIRHWLLQTPAQLALAGPAKANDV